MWRSPCRQEYPQKPEDKRKEHRVASPPGELHDVLAILLANLSLAYAIELVWMEDDASHRKRFPLHTPHAFQEALDQQQCGVHISHRERDGGDTAIGQRGRACHSVSQFECNGYGLQTIALLLHNTTSHVYAPPHSSHESTVRRNILLIEVCIAPGW